VRGDAEHPPLPGAWADDSTDGWARTLGVPRLEVHGVLGSTNAHLRRMARGGTENAAAFTTIVAEAQTEGRGREGRAWHSDRGAGLWISVLVPLDAPGNPGVLPLAAGIATARATERVSGLAVSIKWPNDILVGDRKIAGILCETAGDLGSLAAVGVGVNLRLPALGFPAELSRSAGSLEALAGRPVSEPILGIALIEELKRWAVPTPRLLDGALRREWESRDCLAGQRVRVETGDAGVVSGVSAGGELVLALEGGGTLSVRSGSVRIEGAGGSPALHTGTTV
jgi:BirA family biotin operon repressor/biotin-[acetyl-CoA-carboxylase] ligase